MNGGASSAHSRIPVPRSAVKREASESMNVIVRDSPTAQRVNRLANRDSPNKFLKPSLPAQLPSSPAVGALHRMSLAPTARSPLATPPRRLNERGAMGGGGSHRLSMYGVPLGKNEPPRGGTAANLRRLTMAHGGHATKRIIVCARKRPLSSHEMRVGGQDCIRVDDEAGHMRLSVSRTKLDGLNKYLEEFDFGFDRVYDEAATNGQIYGDVVGPLVRFTCTGGKATCFAYGQTGSGKTHTMFNPRDGQCFQAIADLLRRKGGMFDCHVSFFEIYQGQLYDLLRGRKRVIPCERKDGQMKIMGLEEDVVEDVEGGRDAIQRGLQARMTGKTGANAQSSRSHAILQFTLKPRGDAGQDVIFGRMSFIDLAGSERGADRADVDRRTKLEGSEINKSLLALKECIRAIDQDASHMPFRQSKLTLVLKDSIIGDVRTAMIATVSPVIQSSEHSLNTLRYAERFHEISGPAASRMDFGAGSADELDEEEGGLDDLDGEENVPPAAPPSDWTVSPAPPSHRSSARMAVAADNRHKTHSLGTTPIKMVTFSESAQGLEERRSPVYSLLATIRSQVQRCRDEDVLELLQEELSNISHAFQSLS